MARKICKYMCSLALKVRVEMDKSSVVATIVCKCTRLPYKLVSS